MGLLGPKGLWSWDILYKNAISTFSFPAGLQLPESTVCGRAKALTENQTSREMCTPVVDVSGLRFKTRNSASTSVLVTLTPDTDE